MKPYWQGRTNEYDPTIQPRPEFKAFLDSYLQQKLIQPGQKALDTGCGSGRNLAYLIQRGLDARGFDIREGSVHDARRLLNEVQGLELHGANERVQVGDLRDKFPFNGSYDLVVASGTIHCIEARDQQTVYDGITNAFTQTSDVLRREGFAYIWVKHIAQRNVEMSDGTFSDVCEMTEEPRYQRGVMIVGPTYNVITHKAIDAKVSWHLFTADEIKNLAEESGLSIRNITPHETSKEGDQHNVTVRHNWELILRKKPNNL